MEEGGISHDPNDWASGVLFPWLSNTAVPAIVGLITARTLPKDGQITSTLLAACQKDPQLCVAGHAKLFTQVAAKFSPQVAAKSSQRRAILQPIASTEHIVRQPGFESPDLSEIDASDGASSDGESIEEFALHNPERSHIDLRQGYRRLLDSWDTIRREISTVNFSRHHVDPIIHDVNIPEYEEDASSDTSSNFARELEEEEEIEPETLPPFDATFIVDDEIQKLKSIWTSRRLPIQKSNALKLYTGFRRQLERDVACEIRCQQVKSLQSRLVRIREDLIDGTTGRNEKKLRQQCGVLEATVFDIQKLSFELDILQQILPPPQVEAPKRKPKPARKHTGGDDDSEGELLDTESEAESEDADPQKETEPFTPAIVQPTTELEDLPHGSKHNSTMPSASNTPDRDMAVPDEPEYTMINSSDVEDEDITMRDRSPSPDPASLALKSLSKPPIEVIDLTISDSESETSETSSDNESSEIEIPDLGSSLPVVKEASSEQDQTEKRKATEDLSRPMKKNKTQAQALRRLEETEYRAEMNSQEIRSTSAIVINPGKEDGQEYIYVNEHAAAELKDHQISGLQFLWREIVAQPDESMASGCLLSHTMGLGKTMQAITLLVTIQEAIRSRDPGIRDQIPAALQQSRTLVVCPPSLIRNWDAEFVKWLPKRSTQILGRIYCIEAGDQYRDHFIEDWGTNGGVLIIGYTMFTNLTKSPSQGMLNNSVPMVNSTTPDLEDDTLDDVLVPATQLTRQFLLTKSNLVIFDEAHTVKKTTTQARTAVCKIETKRRVALTGTPLSNHLLEYFSMIDLVSPGYLGNLREFKTIFETPILLGSNPDCAEYEETEARLTLEALEQVLKPKVHRKDASVLKGHLPPKQEFIINIQLTQLQVEVYSAYLDLLETIKARKLLQIGDVLTHGPVLTWILNHPAIFSSHMILREGKKPAERPSFPGLEDSEVNDLIEKAAQRDVIHSNKTMCFLHIVNHSMAQGDKTLCFTQSLETIEYLSAVLRERNIKHEKINGNVAAQARPQLIENFNSGASSVLLISTKAGGTGLNIFGANRVIIYDFGWDPQVEEQAIGRAYRLGQEKPVFVYRFATEGTFEEQLLNQCTRKIQLTGQVLEQKHWRNRVSVTAQRYLKHPTAFAPMLEGAAMHLDGKDAILDGLVEIHRLKPLITSLHDADDWRAEKKPPPLTAEHQQKLDAMIKFAQLGDWFSITQMTRLRPPEQEPSGQVFMGQHTWAEQQQYLIGRLPPEHQSEVVMQHSSSRHGVFGFHPQNPAALQREQIALFTQSARRLPGYFTPEVNEVASPVVAAGPSHPQIISKSPKPNTLPLIVSSPISTTPPPVTTASVAQSTSSASVQALSRQAIAAAEDSSDSSGGDSVKPTPGYMNVVRDEMMATISQGLPQPKLKGSEQLAVDKAPDTVPFPPGQLASRKASAQPQQHGIANSSQYVPAKPVASANILSASLPPGQVQAGTASVQATQQYSPAVFRDVSRPQSLSEAVPSIRRSQVADYQRRAKWSEVKGNELHCVLSTNSAVVRFRIIDDVQVPSGASQRSNVSSAHGLHHRDDRQYNRDSNHGAPRSVQMDHTRVEERLSNGCNDSGRAQNSNGSERSLSLYEALELARSDAEVVGPRDNTFSANRTGSGSRRPVEASYRRAYDRPQAPNMPRSSFSGGRGPPQPARSPSFEEIEPPPNYRASK
ncbi:hypothetical protein BT63DRAFT_58070 [Microthyrium microscopicum]|uniref:SNF2 family helicase/ATPase n=1 Tax=Microthyrium microscopicum TaxID=703497 RepID=A0A6A6U293_9PEZI|nr:hypothetical protein BT63DRAFT_58070 [Microthyrium microscopicum]